MNMTSPYIKKRMYTRRMKAEGIPIPEINEDISPFKKTRKRTKNIKEYIAGENETDLPTIKRNKKQTKDIKKTDGNENEKVNVLMPNAMTANLKTKKGGNTNKKPLAKARSTPVPTEGSLEIIERSPIIGNKAAHNKKRTLETPASERRLVANTAQNKNLELVMPGTSTNCKSSVSECFKEVDPQPKVPLSEHIKDVKKIALENIEKTLNEIQSENTESTLNMCVNMDKKLDQVFKTLRDFNEQAMYSLGKHFRNILKKENERATKRWEEAFNRLHESALKTNSRDLEDNVRDRRRRFPRRN